MKRIFLCAMSVLLPWAVQAAPFADPTRPPNVVESGSGAVATAGARLESVLIAPDRRVAVISGQQVRLGERYRDGQVVRITETEVTIRGADATETLKLFPQAAKQLRAPGDKRPLP